MAEPRPPLPHDPALVRQELQTRALSLLDALGIKERAMGGRVFPLNPTRDDRRAGSFVIWTDGEAAGAWKDYATGEQGDVFDLIGYLRGLARWIDAYWWAVEWLGWGRGVVRSASQDEADRARRERERKAGEARAKGLEDVKARKARGMFFALPDSGIVGTAAWTYLTEARGLPLGGLAHAPHALRFAAELEHIDRESGEVTAWPAMVSAMSDQEGGQIRAVHRTWLRADGLGKAPVAKAKMMLGAAKGCAIRVWKGESGLSPERAAKDGVTGPLVITEGIEDALTAACAQPAYRVWAAGSLSLMGALFWPACASAVVLVADNDWDSPQATEAFEKTAAHWRAMARGRALKVVRAERGKDLNDWARSGAG